LSGSFEKSEYCEEAEGTAVTKVVVCGALGKMGSTVVRLISKAQDMRIAAGVEAPNHPNLGEDLGEVLGLGRLAVALTEDLSAVVGKCDCLLEFSNPQATIEHLKIAQKSPKPYIVGTTGFREEHRQGFEKYARDAPLLVSPNMSVGVNLLFKLAPLVATTLGDSYDIEIVEAHHRMKADAPSGTAKRLGELIAEALGTNLDLAGVYGRKGFTGERSKEEIGIHSLRGGDITGDHTVLYAGPGERVELTHRADSRDAFAYGTIRAIGFVVKAKPGLYDMMDALGLK